MTEAHENQNLPPQPVEMQGYTGNGAGKSVLFPETQDGPPAVELLTNRGLEIVATPKQQEWLFDFWDGFEAFCVNLSSRHGPDIAQNVRLKFLTQAPPTVNELPKMRRWLFTAARHEYIDRAKAERRWEVVDPEELIDAYDFYDGGPDVESTIVKAENGQEARLVVAALSRLLAQDRWALVEELYINGKSQAELAAQWGLDVNIIRARKCAFGKVFRSLLGNKKEKGLKLRAFIERSYRSPIFLRS